MRLLILRITPLNQSGDFDGDKKVTQDDAFYLLYASFGDEECPLNGMIHQYSEPVWTWIEGEETVGAVATIKCGCPDEEPIEFSSVNADNWIEVKAGEVKLVTCTEDGVQPYTAAFNFNGKTYTSTWEITQKATGHDLGGQVLTCETGVACANCDYKVEAKGHKWKLDTASSTPATCNAKAVQVYACEDCEATKEETVEGFGPHAYEFFKDVKKEGCEYVSVYKCAVCEDEEEMGSYFQHTYTAKLTKEATCSVEGEKTYTCTCGESYTETVPTNDSHNWVAGASEAGVTTYSCSCGATKTVVVATADTAVSVSAADELQLDEGASIALDNAVKEQLGEETEIKVSVEVVEEDISLSEEQKEQIGDNPVYDFNMVSVDAEGNEEEVSNFEGKVTVSLPYTLAEGEDIDSIDVWFIADNGELTRMDATYSNGFVTFETTHFSYYTVTRLTAEERCARYGHATKTYTKEASCTAAGYEKTLCTRCGKVESDKTFEALGHDYSVTVTDKKPTCTEAGLLEKKCSVCSHVTSEKIPALGHDLVTTTKDATCKEPGESTIKCNACDYEAIEVLAKLSHNFGTPEVVEATCTAGGYAKAVCADCGYESISGETAALGHNFLETENSWAWSEDNSEATITLSCAHDGEHTKVLNAVVTKKTVNASCTEAGSVTYTASAAYNGKTYSDSKSAEGGEATGHKPAVEWTGNASGHYHLCTACGEKLGTENHTWGTETVIKAPTCTTAGEAKVVCSVCGYETEKVLPSTGEHTYVNGICSVCGHDEGACDHVRLYKTEIDLSGYDLCEGSQIWMRSCDCGEKNMPWFSLACVLTSDDQHEETITLPNGEQGTMWVTECPLCGVEVRSYSYTEIDEENCKYLWVEYYKLSKDGEVILEGTARDYMEDHPYKPEPIATYDLAEYGLCEGTCEILECPCGWLSTWSFTDGCNWTVKESTEEDGVTTTTYTCSECNATRVWKSVFEEDPATCTWTSHITNTFYVNGEVVLEFTLREGFAQHDYEVASYELDGKSCEDGVLIVWKCRRCGHESKDYFFVHETFINERIDLTGKGVCTDTVIQYSCPCGEYLDYMVFSFSEGSTQCVWNWTENEDGSQRTGVCEVCGMTQNITTDWSEKDENCLLNVSKTNVITDSKGNELATVYSNWTTTDHDWKRSYELMVEGGSCADGLKITEYCGDCDFSNSWVSHDHIGIAQETLDLSGLNMCCDEAARFVCPCGESEWFGTSDSNGNHCSWYWQDDWETGREMYCFNCDSTWTIEWEDLEWVDSCHVKRHYHYTFQNAEQNTAEIEVDMVDTIHAGETYDLQLMNPDGDCTDGFTVTMNCTVCGASENYGTQHDHGCWPVERELICEEGLCGKLTTVQWSCACGRDSWINLEWEDGECQFEYYGWDSELKAEVSKCDKCGATRTRKSVETTVEGETCRFNSVTTYTFYDKDGNELCHYSAEESGESHDTLTSFNMQGDTCEDGYYMIQTCMDCGQVMDYNQYSTSCETWRTGKESFYTSDCGELALYQWTSPCGEKEHWNLEGACNFNWLGWNEELGLEIRECVNCGLQVGATSHQESIPGSCIANRTDIFTVIVDGEGVASTSKSYQTQSHEYVHSFQLNGESCDDGYLVSARCAYCGEQQSWEEMHYGHEHYQLELYDLTEYGLCSGEYVVYGCPCGLSYGFGHRGWDCSRTEIDVVDPVSNMPIQRCDETGVYFVFGEIGEVDRENCQYNGTHYLRIFGTDYNADPVLDLAHPVSGTSHTHKATSLTLLNPEGTCTDGVYAEYECVYCDDVGSETYYWHRDWDTFYLDLNEYADTCGGELRMGSCACGENSYFHEGYNCHMETVEYREETDANGIRHEIWNKACPNCKLTMVEDRYEVSDPENCVRNTNWNYTISVNGAVIADVERTYVSDLHDYVGSGVLMEGATSCEQGVYFTNTCRRCGHTENYTTNSHEVYLAETIDLAQYGSNCGAALNHFTCACGAEERYDFAADTACDLDRQQLDSNEWWISDVLNDSQYTSESYRGAWSYFYNIKCAVSDPACGLSMRMAEYWQKEGCQATEYQNWQILDANGNVVWEDTVCTGETMAFHNYTRTPIQETQADGSGIAGYLNTCADCGSTHQEMNYYNADGENVKYEHRAVNTLDNGENQQWYNYVIYDYVANGFRYMSEDYDEYTYATGEVSWNRWEYTYDFSGSCIRYVTYSNSSGYSDTHIDGDAHMSDWHSKYLEPTCSQFGYFEEYGYCDVCGDRWDSYYEQYEPKCHNWYATGTGTYRCSFCDLESTQGASGVIVMEDLSGHYHEGYSYIVGYWNRENLDFVPNVSVVLDDVAEGEDNLIENLDVAVNDLMIEDVVAKYIDKATAIAAAEAAMADAGYTGNYAIRITFVPVNYSDDLDYAITFDTLTYDPAAH